MKIVKSKICTCVLYAHAFWIPIIHCDIFSALCKLQELPGKEKELISTFDRFLSKKRETSDIRDLKRFVDDMRYANKLISKNPRCLENPVNSYKFLYRIVAVWGQRLQQYSNCSVQDNTSLPYFINSVYNNSQSMSTWPNQTDLDGAGLALIRIGNAYNINSRRFHSGIFASSTISNLTGFDVLNIGLTASRVDHLYDAKKWLTDAIHLLSTERNTIDLIVRAYRSLGNIYNRLNAPQLAVDVLKQALTIGKYIY
ncbi:hypothetical protein LOTGIDRAFT_233739 [Lottia gigantea]|uniref:Prolyl 4-hydroxylase N-terminal domain-containing protein n=1 Tax=Lottia gigantea TaxID=225164 RepID=V3ZHG4_LOTGI|nr:hypothetical protein LOTGIDRAFT_233739 [Lottia gigantea]ESO90708.1 hypothetical protein LOTGIDRAFT_233739 [Lottia gigantea]